MLEEFPETFDSSLHENEMRKRLGLMSNPIATTAIRVSDHIEVMPGVGIGDETYRDIGAGPTADSFSL